MADALPAVVLVKDDVLAPVQTMSRSINEAVLRCPDKALRLSLRQLHGLARQDADTITARRAARTCDGPGMADCSGGRITPLVPGQRRSSSRRQDTITDGVPELSAGIKRSHTPASFEITDDCGIWWHVWTIYPPSF